MTVTQTDANGVPLATKVVTDATLRSQVPETVYSTPKDQTTGDTAVLAAPVALTNAMAGTASAIAQNKLDVVAQLPIQTGLITQVNYRISNHGKRQATPSLYNPKN